MIMAVRYIFTIFKSIIMENLVMWKSNGYRFSSGEATYVVHKQLFYLNDWI